MAPIWLIEMNGRECGGGGKGVKGLKLGWNIITIILLRVLFI